jgi:uncharacterized protein involved in response to NO
MSSRLPPIVSQESRVAAGTSSARGVPPRTPVSPRWLGAAPHRAFFFGGSLVLAIATAWWGLRLAARGGVAPALGVAVPDLWAHAWLMTYGVMPGFVYGFLFTTFPRWMNASLVARRTYVAVAATYGVALALGIAGLAFGLPTFTAGAALLAMAWFGAWGVLIGVLLRAEAIVSHAVVAGLALGIGGIGAAAAAWGLYTLDGTLVHTALRAGLQACWLPLVYAVCHRMVPFFTQSAVPGYVAHRPTWWLVAFTAAAYLHQVVALYGRFEWLWLPSVAMATVATLTLVRWRPLASRHVPLLWTLHLSYAWLPLALWLQTAQAAGFALRGEWLLGRAPLHALAVGFFVSLVVAMATRVTLGHSGRPLAMDRYTVGCFLAVQLAALLRVGSELVAAGSPLAGTLLVASAVAFAAGVTAWFAKYGPIYLRARSDGRPG